MPDMTGAEVISEARKMVGDVPGDPGHRLCRHGRGGAAGRQAASILRKPFDIGALGDAVALAMAGAREDA